MAGNVVDFDPQTATILLVDDDAALRSLIRTPLQRCGYHVLEADSGEVATRIAEQAERIHLLLTELATPAISGLLSVFSALLDRELSGRGRALEAHGLGDFAVREIRALLHEGWESSLWPRALK